MRFKVHCLMFLFILSSEKFGEIFCVVHPLIHCHVTLCTGGKHRNYHEIVLTQFCSQATSGTRRGSFQTENWIKKGWCHFHFCFILQLRMINGEIRQCGSV